MKTASPTICPMCGKDFCFYCPTCDQPIAYLPRLTIKKATKRKPRLPVLSARS